MHILDTDTLSHLHRGHPRLLENIRRRSIDAAATTVVTKAEILQARYDFLFKAASEEEFVRAQEWLTRSEELLAGMTVLPMTAQAAEQTVQLIGNRRLRRIGRRDLMIAGIVLSRRATLVTRNTKHFP